MRFWSACHTATATGTATWAYTALPCPALCCTARHCAALLRTALHCTTALHYTALRRAALHCTALHCTALHCTAPCMYLLLQLVQLIRLGVVSGGADLVFVTPSRLIDWVTCCNWGPNLVFVQVKRRRVRAKRSGHCRPRQNMARASTDASAGVRVESGACGRAAYVQRGAS